MLVHSRIEKDPTRPEVTGSVMNRRDFLVHSGGGLGGIALAALLGNDRLLADSPARRADGGIHHAPRAKRVVQLFMAGGASHIDLFDFKPELIKQTRQTVGLRRTGRSFSERPRALAAPRVGLQAATASPASRSSEVVAPLGDVVDEIAFVHNMVGKTGVHRQGTLLQTTGFNRPGFPGMGCWVSYGLGSMNENLPTFVVLPDHRGFASNGTKNWDSAFLPAQHQGTVIYPGTKNPDRRPLSGRARRSTSRRPATRPGLSMLDRAEPRPCRDTARRRAARRPHPELRAGREDATGRAGGSRSLQGDHAHAEALRSRPRQIHLRQGDQPHRRDRLLRPQMPGRSPPARARRALRADLDRQRQRLPPPQLGHSRGREARPRPAGVRHGPRRRGPHRRPQAARPARRHDRPVDDRVRPHAVVARGARAATTTPTASPTGWPAAASRGASPTARATTSATSPPTASIPPKSTTSTPRCCTSWASTTPGSPSATTASTAA